MTEKKRPLPIKEISQIYINDGVKWFNETFIRHGRLSAVGLAAVILLTGAAIKVVEAKFKHKKSRP